MTTDVGLSDDARAWAWVLRRRAQAGSVTLPGPPLTEAGTVTDLNHVSTTSIELESHTAAAPAAPCCSSHWQAAGVRDSRYRGYDQAAGIMTHP